MPDKPLCPYCGPWNGHPDGVEMKETYHVEHFSLINIWWRCPICGSTSPIATGIYPRCASQAHDEAYQDAISRFRPMQKPLTLEEVKRHIAEGNERPLYIEFNFSAKPNFRGTSFYPLWRAYDNIQALIRHEERYNVEFRFWWEKPTDEERAAASWEE